LYFNNSIPFAVITSFLFYIVLKIALKYAYFVGKLEPGGAVLVAVYELALEKVARVEILELTSSVELIVLEGTCVNDFLGFEIKHTVLAG